MCQQLGGRWVKGLRCEGSRGQMFKCSSQETIHRIHTQTWGETVWVWLGSGGWRWSTSSLSVPAGRVSPSSKVSLNCLYMFHSLLPFTHFPCLFRSSCLTHYPSLILFLLHPFPEVLSSELPRFFIKEISLKPSNYYGKRKKREERRRALRETSSFCSFPMTLSRLHKCVHIICISPFEKIETGWFFAPHVVCQPSIPPPALSLSLSLSLRLSVNGVIWFSNVIASFSFGKVSL